MTIVTEWSSTKVFREADKSVATVLSSRKDGHAYHHHKAQGERRQKEYYLARVFSYSMQNRWFTCPPSHLYPDMHAGTIFNNNSFRSFADTPLKSLETTQEGRDGEGDGEDEIQGETHCIFSFRASIVRRYNVMTNRRRD